MPTSTTQPTAEVPAPKCDLIAKHTGGAMTIDGNLDESDWSQTPATADYGGPFTVDGKPDDLHAQPEYRTFSKVLWDKDTLYIAFVARAPEVYANMTKHDDKLYEQDVVEVFMDMGTDGSHYIELQASPNGVTGDHYHTFNPPPTYPADKLDWAQNVNHKMEDWDLPGFKAAGKPMMEDGKQVGFIVEMAIPVAYMLGRREMPTTLHQGQTVRMNMLRYAWLPGEKETDKRIHHQMNWSPTVKGCPHVSPMAMKVVGLDK